MADARNKVEFDDIGVERATFKIDGVTITYDSTKTGGTAAATLNKAVTMSADDTVALAADGDSIVGKLLHVESDSKCVVQTDGFCDLPGGDGSTVTRGAAIVGALGAASAKGYIRAAASGTAAELIKCRGRIIRNGTHSAIVVRL